MFTSAFLTAAMLLFLLPKLVNEALMFVLIHPLHVASVLTEALAA